MTYEAWCWVDGLALLLGYRRPSAWTDGLYPRLRLLGQHKRHRIISIRGPGAAVGTRLLRPGWVRVSAGPQDRDFDMADPDSMEKAAAFVRSTYAKAQRAWEQQRRPEGAEEPSPTPERAP